MKELIKKSWEYILYEVDDGRNVLSVFGGGVGIFALNILLDNDEVKEYREKGNNYIDLLASSVQHSPLSFKHRHVDTDFESNND